MHGSFVRGMASQFVGIDAVDAVIAGPLDNGNKARVRIRGAVEKGPENHLVVKEGLQQVCEVIRGDLQ